MLPLHAMEKKIVIAVDGYASCGKSTLAKDLAKELDYIYIDSGAMYRAVTLFLLEKEYDLNDTQSIIDSLRYITIEFRKDEFLNKNVTFLNNRNVESQIRNPKVSKYVSEVSAIKEVRTFLVDQQRKLGEEKGIVMDGRDIGTVVFKDAELKLFVSADLEIRAKRRYEEMVRKGITITLEEVKENLEHRDHYDTHRDESPLYQSDDALLFDNTILSPAQQLKLVLNLSKAVIKEVNTGEETVEKE